MSTDTAISARNVSKRYWLYRRYRDRLRQSFLSGLLGRDFAQPFWALHDINFDVLPGQVLGVIGQNGSGKSTLLQIVVGTLQPTEGSVQKHGRLTALLELGAGFHPEFTGRENIFLSGATLGIPEREMKQRLGQIIDFSGIDEFIDQPVKLYSSGMYVRLAFAIATSVDPEILVVDEALAVGDASFVIKCLKRMEQLKKNGCAILYVTHDIQSVRSFCDRALWLNKGLQAAIGPTLEVTSKYIQFLFNRSRILEENPHAGKPAAPAGDATLITGDLIELKDSPDLIRWGTREMIVEGYALRNQDSTTAGIFEYGDRMVVELQVRAVTDIKSADIGFGFAFRNERGLEVINSTTYDVGTRFPPMKQGQRTRLTFELENILAPGMYSLVLSVEDRTSLEIKYYDFIENAAVFRTISQMIISSVVLPDVRQTFTTVD